MTLYTWRPWRPLLDGRLARLVRSLKVEVLPPSLLVGNPAKQARTCAEPKQKPDSANLAAGCCVQYQSLKS